MIVDDSTLALVEVNICSSSSYEWRDYCSLFHFFMTRDLSFSVRNVIVKNTLIFFLRSNKCVSLTYPDI